MNLTPGNEYWWAQPLCTLLAGALVLLSAALTLIYTNWRFRVEQSRKRASDREGVLQEAYAALIGAGLATIKARHEIAEIDADLEADDHGYLPPEAIDPSSTHENLLKVKSDLRGYERDLVAAYSRLLIVDVRPERLARCGELMPLAGGVHISKKEREAFEQIVQSVAIFAAQSIAKEYAEEAHLERRGASSQVWAELAASTSEVAAALTETLVGSSRGSIFYPLTKSLFDLIPKKRGGAG